MTIPKQQAAEPFRNIYAVCVKELGKKLLTLKPTQKWKWFFLHKRLKDT